jgi:ABC-type transport system involved in multi-copper enzyme maturation permease subunit
MHRATLIATGALIRDTFREALARKIFWGLYGFSTAVLLFLLFLMRIDVVEGALATISMFGQTAETLEVARLVRQVYGSIASFLYGAGMFIAVFASAGLIPTIFEPGRIELLLSKPVTRHHILIGRYLGNLLVIAANICYLVLGAWVIFGLKTGFWAASFLYAIPTTVFMFAVLLSAVVLVSVLSESAALATIVTFGLMVMSVILAQRDTMVKLFSSQWARDLWTLLYHIVPKVYEVGKINMDVAQGYPVGDQAPLGSSAIFCAAVFGLGTYVFSRRSY